MIIQDRMIDKHCSIVAEVIHYCAWNIALQRVSCDERSNNCAFIEPQPSREGVSMDDPTGACEHDHYLIASILEFSRRWMGNHGKVSRWRMTVENG